jgi:hypothetical protein
MEVITETTLRNEIARRAPEMKILLIGALFGGTELDALVEDRRGQYLWSVYRREMNPQPPEPAVATVSGQLSMF